jgi:hypothetical protein
MQRLIIRLFWSVMRLGGSSLVNRTDDRLEYRMSEVKAVCIEII